MDVLTALHALAQSVSDAGDDDLPRLLNAAASEINALKAEVKQLKTEHTDIAAKAYHKGYMEGGDAFRSRITIPLDVVTGKAESAVITLYPDSDLAKTLQKQINTRRSA